MFKAELCGRVRRAVLVDGVSQRTVAREFGISRKSVRKMVSFSVPPGHRRQQAVKRPKPDPWAGVTDAILEDDKQRPVRQRHAAKRVWERLREEHQFTGGYTIVKGHPRSAARRSREMFIPPAHPAGEARADFGEALAVIAGVERKAHCLVVDPPRSDDCFVIAFPAETAEAFPEGHVKASAHFGGAPTRILYDNTKIAVAKILGGAGRKRARAFSELRSRCLFADKFGRPAKGNDKGKVEGPAGCARRNFTAPIPRFATRDAFNTHLEAACRKRRRRAAEDLDYPRYLLRMAELELLGRERRAAERRVRQAKFPMTKSLDSFDFPAMPTLNKAMAPELARCGFLTRRENVLLLGNSGAGKTRIAPAPGLAACQQGHRVRLTTAAALVHELTEARDERKLPRFQKQIAGHELLIADELGFVPLSETGAELLFEMLGRRRERGSTMLTSNPPFAGWTGVLGSERLPGALLDRPAHHVHILEMNGDSFRLKQSRRRRTPNS